MSEFRFPCPECGQKILGDTTYAGIRINCPTCQKPIVIPAPSPAPEAAVAGISAPTPSAPVEVAPGARGPVLPAPVDVAAKASTPAPAAAAPEKSRGLSGLAVASLMCSVLIPLGFVPGLICGHMAKAKMRRNIFLEGEKLANTGLAISYSVLAAFIVLAGVAGFEQFYYHPVKVVRESPEALAAIQPRVVDEVIMGETDDDHDVDGQSHYTGRSNNKAYHTTDRGGSFSYMMKVLPERAVTLNCRYWGSEKKNHVFEIAIDNQVIATQDLTGIAPGHFVDVEYKIPASLTRGKSQVKVEFQALPGAVAGNLYACQILKR